jgi:HD-like signal output (HDOD) protein
VDATHNELGRRMAERWKLPAHVVRVCAEHHAPTVTAKEDRELHIVRVVEGLSDLGSNPHWPLRRLEEIRESAAGLGVDRFRLRATVTQIREYAKKAVQLANAVEPT